MSSSPGTGRSQFTIWEGSWLCRYDRERRARSKNNRVTSPISPIVVPSHRRNLILRSPRGPKDVARTLGLENQPPDITLIVTSSSPVVCSPCHHLLAVLASSLDSSKRPLPTTSCTTILHRRLAEHKNNRNESFKCCWLSFIGRCPLGQCVERPVIQRRSLD